METRGWSYVRKGPQAKEYRQLLEAEQGQEMVFPLRVLIFPSETNFRLLLSRTVRK